LRRDPALSTSCFYGTINFSLRTGRLEKEVVDGKLVRKILCFDNHLSLVRIRIDNATSISIITLLYQVFMFLQELYIIFAIRLHNIDAISVFNLDIRLLRLSFLLRNVLSCKWLIIYSVIDFIAVVVANYR